MQPDLVAEMTTSARLVADREDSTDVSDPSRMDRKIEIEGLYSSSTKLSSLRDALQKAEIKDFGIIADHCVDHAMDAYPRSKPKAELMAYVFVYTFDYGSKEAAQKDANPYRVLNAAMMTCDSVALMKVAPLLYGLLSALRSLPYVQHDTLLRGLSVRVAWKKGEVKEWKTFTSMTKDIAVTKKFFNHDSEGRHNGTLIHAVNLRGYDITGLSLIKNESEVLVEPYQRVVIDDIFDNGSLVTAYVSDAGNSSFLLTSKIPMSGSRGDTFKGPLALLNVLKSSAKGQDSSSPSLPEGPEPPPEGFVNLPMVYPCWPKVKGAITSTIQEVNSVGCEPDAITKMATILIDLRKTFIGLMKSTVGVKKPSVTYVEDALRKGAGDTLDYEGSGVGNYQTVKSVVIGILTLAAEIETVFTTTTIPILDGQHNTAAVFSRDQCASLIACGILGIMSTCKETAAFDFGEQMNRDTSKGQLFPGVVHYLFRFLRARGVKTPLQGYVTIQRPSGMPLTPSNMQYPLCQVRISSENRIEDYVEALQASFANASVGGDVLGSKGCTQEDIRFGLVSPECLVSLLVAKEIPLGDLEALIIKGSEMFSEHTGYANKTRWAGDFKDPTPCTAEGVNSCLVALDATRRPAEREYTKAGFDRELNKAYTAFSCSAFARDRDVSTGLWGCGDFQCSVDLKFLQQWIACSCGGDHSTRTMYFSTFKEVSKETQCKAIVEYVHAAGITEAAQLYKVVMEYCNFVTANFPKVQNYPKFAIYLAERYGFQERKVCLTAFERARK